MPNKDILAQENTAHEDFGYGAVTDAYLEVIKSNWAWTNEWIKEKPDPKKLARIHEQYDNNVKLLSQRIEEFENKHPNGSLGKSVPVSVQGMASGGLIDKTPKAGTAAAEEDDPEKLKKKAAKKEDDKFLTAALMQKKKITDETKFIEQQKQLDKFTEQVRKLILPGPTPETESLGLAAKGAQSEEGFFASMFDSLVDARDKLSEHADDPEIKRILEAINLKLTDPVLLGEMSKLEEEAELDKLNALPDIKSVMSDTIRNGNQLYGEEINELPDDLSGKDFEDEKTRLMHYLAGVIAEKTARNTIKAMTMELEGEELASTMKELRRDLLSEDAIAENTQEIKEHPGLKHIMRDVKNVKDMKVLFKKAADNDANELIKELAKHTTAAVKEETAKAKPEPEKKPVKAAAAVKPK